MNYDKLPEWRLWLRALLPSPASLIGSFMVTAILIGFHLVLLAGEPELLVPRLAGQAADDDLVQVYRTVIQEPVDNVFGNSLLGTISTALVWGIVGWGLYTVIDFISRTIRELRTDSGQVGITSKNQLVRHPLHRQLIIRMLWRFAVGLLLVVVSVAFQPLISRLFQYDVQLLTADTSLEAAKSISLALAGWIGLMHLYVMLFRLFVLRTRVFGEIIF